MFGDELKKMLRLGMEGGRKEKGSIAITGGLEDSRWGFLYGRRGATCVY